MAQGLNLGGNEEMEQVWRERVGGGGTGSDDGGGGVD